jgi:hypothetical protein
MEYNIWRLIMKKKNKDEIKNLIPGSCFHGECWYQCPHCDKGIEAHSIRDTDDNIHECSWCGGKFYYKR